MARKKRASLKDKGPEALGLTQKKGKGIDVLFGGPTGEAITNTSPATTPDPKPQPASSKADKIEDVTTAAVSAQIEPDEAKDASESILGDEPMSDDSAEKLPGSEEESLVAPPPSPPVTATFAGEEVDEFGLPVAMEAPPDDLEFAPPPEAGEEPVVGEGEERDAFDPALSPFAAPPPAATGGTDDDLIGLMEEDDLSGLAFETESTPPPVATIPAEEFPTGTADDLSGLAPEPAAPIDVPAASIPTWQPVTSTPAFPPSAPPAPTPAPVQPRPVPAPPPGPVTPPPPVYSPARVEAIEGMVTQPVGTTAADLLPPDAWYEQGASNVIAVDERAAVEKDEFKAARVTRYVGRERRENLDMEIERLYNEVAKDLSVNRDDAEYALRTLSEAQDIVLEDTRQYDEALYRVAVVKTMLARKRNLRRWSYTWGVAVFFYAVVWLAAFIAGFVATDMLRATLGDSSEGLMAIRSAWFSALAGGIGGVIGIFYSLYWHVAMKQDFDRQYVMYYLVQPIMGFILGALIHFILVAGFLVFRINDQAVDTLTALGVVIGFTAGFRQRVVFEMIDRIVKRLLPRSEDEPDASPVSVVPVESRENIQPPPA